MRGFLAELISCYEQCSSWEEQLKGAKQRTAAMESLADNAAKLFMYITTCNVVQLLKNNPFEVPVPFDEFLLPIKKLMTFLSVSGAYSTISIQFIDCPLDEMVEEAGKVVNEKIEAKKKKKSDAKQS